MAAQINKKDWAASDVSSEELRQLLDRILKSKHFTHAPKKQKFIQLICDFYAHGRAHELNEYLIGREVFDRDDSYNPAADPIVRVGAHDVRKRLELYYQHEGANDELRLEIPIGSYEPAFIRRPAASPSAPQSRIEELTASVPEEPRATAQSTVEEAATSPRLVGTSRIKDTSAPLLPRGEARKWQLVLGTLALLLAAAVATLAISNRELKQQVRQLQSLGGPDTYGPVWEPFLKSNDPTLLVLSNPPAYRFANAGDPQALLKNAVTLSPEQTVAISQALKGRFISRNTPAPRLILSLESYTGIGEAIGLQRVTELFRGTGRGVLLKQSRTVSAEDLKNHNLVLLGSVWVNEWSGKLPAGEDFVYTGSATIENRRPRAGEEREYRSKFDEQTGELKEDYALITVKPNISDENTVMILAGIRSAGTEAASEFVTNKSQLQELRQKLLQVAGSGGPPKYYQALLKANVENGIPTTITLLTVHELNPTNP